MFIVFVEEIVQIIQISITAMKLSNFLVSLCQVVWRLLDQNCSWGSSTVGSRGTVMRVAAVNEEVVGFIIVNGVEVQCIKLIGDWVSVWFVITIVF